MTEGLNRIQIETTSNPEFCIIWLHGLGADGYDFVPVVKELENLGAPPARYLFPHANKIPVSINGGMVMPAWYDIKHVDLQREEDLQGIEDSRKKINLIIDEQINKGIPSEKIILAGFSQGGAVAYQTALRHDKKLGALIALSTYLTQAEQIEQLASTANRQIPIFAGHGSNDQVVPIQRGQNSANCLKNLNYSVTWKAYPMEHSVCGEEIADIAAFIKQHCETTK